MENNNFQIACNNLKEALNLGKDYKKYKGRPRKYDSNVYYDTNKGKFVIYKTLIVN